MFSKEEALRYEEEGKTYQEIGDIYSVSRQRIEQLYKKLLGRSKKTVPKNPKEHYKKLEGICSCGRIFEKKSFSARFCPQCLMIFRKAHLDKIKKTEKYRKNLSLSKVKWWAEQKERRILLSEKLKEAWKERRQLDGN